MNNPYEYLGVSRNATEKDIMDAYRRIAGEITNANIPDTENINNEANGAKKSGKKQEEATNPAHIVAKFGLCGSNCERS